MSDRIQCPWCGQITTIVWVHGHGQCAICTTNIDECCRGEQAPFVDSARPPSDHESATQSDADTRDADISDVYAASTCALLR